METHDQPCRDVHGMEVSRDHKELLDMYSPVWEQEELARCDSWQQFLTRAAGALVELGVLPTGRTEPSEQSVILQALLANRQRLAPQLVKELGQLVSSGIPRPLRGLAWQQLLGAPQAFPDNYYESLLYSMQGEAQADQHQQPAPPASKCTANTAHCSSCVPAPAPLLHLPSRDFSIANSAAEVLPYPMGPCCHKQQDGNPHRDTQHPHDVSDPQQPTACNMDAACNVWGLPPFPCTTSLPCPNFCV